MNIIFLNPIYKDYIWGGNKLEKKLNKKTPYKNTAESWEISSNENGICQIINKEYEGKNLKKLFEENKTKEMIFGKKCKELKEFPLLIKFIDAKEDLSIQVHPDNEYAKKIGLQNGKSEMWYILDCKENGEIIGGLKNNLNIKELKTVIEQEKIKEYLNYIPIKKGDAIYIPSGTVHAILKNTLICEIQQNSDITYRIFDWDRKDKNGKKRLLNKKEAIDVIKTKSKPIIIHDQQNNNCQEVTKNEFFKVERIKCKEFYESTSNLDTFYAINIIEGKGTIQTSKEKHNIEKGNSFIIPASLGKYTINGKVTFLKSYII